MNDPVLVDSPIEYIVLLIVIVGVVFLLGRESRSIKQSRRKSFEKMELRRISLKCS